MEVFSSEFHYVAGYRDGCFLPECLILHPFGRTPSVMVWTLLDAVRDLTYYKLQDLNSQHYIMKYEDPEVPLASFIHFRSKEQESARKHAALNVKVFLHALHVRLLLWFGFSPNMSGIDYDR